MSTNFTPKTYNSISEAVSDILDDVQMVTVLDRNDWSALVEIRFSDRTKRAELIFPTDFMPFYDIVVED